MTSLLTENWLPVRRRSGQLGWVAPHQISDPDIVAFAANRADFNGALAQFVIGLLQTSAPINDEADWQDYLEQPPTPEQLQQWFAPVADAFVLDGDGPRFMQDFSMRESDGAECAIDAVLIDAAGGSAIDKNTDHFVKRNTVNQMCLHCTATALLSLQINAPAGGAGHRTSLRGGGPLTALVVATPAKSLWHDLWLNVKPQPLFLQQGGDVQKKEASFTFPWLTEVKTIQPAVETQPLQVHPYHVFWAMPRRIRLNLADAKTSQGRCDICKRDALPLVRHYVTKPQGLNYKGPWRHPFSPYYETKEGWLPVHPQPGGFSYKNWLAWVLGVNQSKKQIVASANVNYFLHERKRKQKSGQFRLWVFGYDMDNMKARCWYETQYPLYDLADTGKDTERNVQSLVSQYIESAELAVSYVRQAVKQAWFGESEARGDFSFVDKAFWDGTEQAFYQQLQLLLQKAKSETGLDMDDAGWLLKIRQAWFDVLLKRVRQLFDVDIVGAGSLAQENPRRIAEAYDRLVANMHGKALKQVLGLPVAEKPTKPGKTTSKKGDDTPASLAL